MLTSERLLCGTVLGFFGGFLSLTMAIFTSQCDATHYMPTWIHRDGKRFPCKTSLEKRVTNQFWTTDNGMVVNVPGTECHSHSDCADGQFCAGGPGGLKQDG